MFFPCFSMLDYQMLSSNTVWARVQVEKYVKFQHPKIFGQSKLCEQNHHAAISPYVHCQFVFFSAKQRWPSCHLPYETIPNARSAASAGGDAGMWLLNGQSNWNGSNIGRNCWKTPLTALKTAVFHCFCDFLLIFFVTIKSNKNMSCWFLHQNHAHPLGTLFQSFQGWTVCPSGRFETYPDGTVHVNHQWFWAMQGRHRTL